jgi:hypothetical protein
MDWLGRRQGETCQGTGCHIQQRACISVVRSTLYPTDAGVTERNIVPAASTHDVVCLFSFNMDEVDLVSKNSARPKS